MEQYSLVQLHVQDESFTKGLHLKAGLGHVVHLKWWREQIM